MNAFFASVEQQRQPHLRGKPVAVVPTLTERTCCIAVSYEARPFDVRTGDNVGEAVRRCPGLQLVEGKHEHYVAAHHKILEAVERVLPIERICSIDEVACRLAPADRTPRRAERVAAEVKRVVAEHAGEYLRCSVGIAPNRWLAKIASNLQKPDGLSILTRQHLPYRLHRLALDDLTGIGKRMRQRLAHRGVTSTRQLCSLSKPAMREVWGSVIGEHWWHWLRGDEVQETPTTRQTVGHSHVLPPKLRTREGSHAVAVRLLHKAAARLRKEGYAARRLELAVRFVGQAPSWKSRTSIGRTGDTPTLLKALAEAWPSCPTGPAPLQVAVTLSRLEPAECVTKPLFAEDQAACRAAQTMDAVNHALGPNKLYFASMHDTRESAPMRIAFTRIPDLATELGGT